VGVQLPVEVCSSALLPGQVVCQTRVQECCLLLYITLLLCSSNHDTWAHCMQLGAVAMRIAHTYLPERPKRACLRVLCNCVCCIPCVTLMAGAILSTVWAANAGVMARGIQWQRFTQQQLLEICECVGGLGLAAVLRLMAEDHAGAAGRGGVGWENRNCFGSF
jgi:hypothetical protein